MSRKFISNILTETEQSILRKTAYGLPDRPSESGMRADEIKKAFYSAITDSTDSVMSEMKRIIGESNEVFDGIQASLDSKMDNENHVSTDFAESERLRAKNLFFPNNKKGFSITKGGVTAVVNDDFSITLNGTSTGVTYFNLSKGLQHATGASDRPTILDENKTYTYLTKFISGSVDNPASLILASRAANTYGSTTIIANADLTNSSPNLNFATFTGVNELNSVLFATQKSTTYDNFTFAVMICEGEDRNFEYFEGDIIHESQIMDVEHVRTLYDMNSESADVNWGYGEGSGISSTNVDDDTLANGKVLITHPYIDLTKYKGVKVYMIAGNETFVAEGYNYEYNTYRGGGGGYAHSWNYSQSAEFDFYIGSTEFLFRPRLRTASGELKVLNSEYCYIYKIEGVL